jgi:poly(3-hydroxybutyrate) depolymerase
VRKLVVVLVCGLVAGVAMSVAPVAHGQAAPTAVCTHVGLLSVDGADAARRIDAAMNAHLMAGRERITVLTTQPVPGVMVCAY